MRLIQSDSIELSPWADDEHDPLTSEARGPLPAYHRLANGQTVRAQPIRRVPAPPRIGFCSRLHNRLRSWYLSWLLNNLRARLDQLELSMSAATDDAMHLAKLHRVSPALHAYRRAMRTEHEALYRQWLIVRRDLDTLERSL